ncbi:hypothetical protein [Methanobacterium sp. MBAC-LM]|uniref:hypothetical protein n=1 Tax=Methanobacterium sp. MBAC-LM TaxID=3412034 RepID=UPI003C76FA16
MDVPIASNEFDFDSYEFRCWKEQLNEIINCINQNRIDEEYLSVCINNLFQDSLQLNKAVKIKPHLLNIEIKK